MDHSKRVHGLIFEAIEAIRETLPHGAAIPSSPEAPLLESAGGALDSLGVVNLMVEVETRIAAEFSQSVSLVPALAELPATSPFRTVATLAEYVGASLASAKDG